MSSTSTAQTKTEPTPYTGLRYKEREVFTTLKSILILCLLGAACSTGLAFILVNPLSMQAVPFYLYSVISFLLIARTHAAYSRARRAVNPKQPAPEDRLDSLLDSRKAFTLSGRIVRHEISNELMCLSHCIHLLKQRKDGDYSREINDIRQCLTNIPKIMALLSEQTTEPTPLLAVLKVVFQGNHVSIDIEPDAVANVPMAHLVAFANNIHENAREAYERRYGSQEGLRITVSFREKTLSIEDNAGGFDTNAIASGNSSKGAGHGIFLATFLNDTGHLGIKPTVEQTGSGTRINIVFENVMENSSNA